MPLPQPPISPRLSDIDALRAKLVSGELVSRPFVIGQGISADTVSATCTNVAAVPNKDGSGTILFAQVTSGEKGIRFQQQFFGTKFGIRFSRSNLSTLPDEFTVQVDGVAYRIYTRITKAVVYSQSFQDDICNILLDEDFPEGDHLAQITVVAPSSGTHTIRFLGYLVEKRAGYIPVPYTDVLLSNGNTPATASAAAIYDCLADATTGRRVSKIRYHNNTGSTAVVVVKYDANSAGFASATPYAQLTIPDKDSAELTFNPSAVLNSLWLHGSAAGGANLPYFVFGSY
jgi:hypothetical protein